MAKKMNEQEYAEKDLELFLKIWDMAGKADSAKTQKGYDKYMDKALKAMVSEAKLGNEYERQKEQKDEPYDDYDDGL